MLDCGLDFGLDWTVYSILADYEYTRLPNEWRNCLTAKMGLNATFSKTGWLARLGGCCHSAYSLLAQLVGRDRVVL